MADGMSLCVGGDSLLQDTPKMSDLMSQVAAKMKDKWFQVGIQLDIDMATLLSYKTQSRDPMRCYTSVFVEWKRDHKLPYTWATIIGALESNDVTEVAVANEVREWLAHRQLGELVGEHYNVYTISLKISERSSNNLICRKFGCRQIKYNPHYAVYKSRIRSV